MPVKDSTELRESSFQDGSSPTESQISASSSRPATASPLPAPDSGLHRDISTRQIIMMALGGSIGAGLFVGSGQALGAGGPGSLLVNFAIVGIMVCGTMSALGEMAASYPVEGAFYDYTVRFIGRPWGFAMGWNYVFNWLIVLPFELTTIGAQLKFWNPSLQPVYFIAPFLALVTLAAFRGSRWFAELEHGFGIVKVAGILTFIVFALILVTAGLPADPRGALGARYWRDPGAFLNGLQGFLMVFRVAGMSYGGTEALGLTVAECKRPHKTMPLATYLVFARLVVLYLVALLMMGFVVSATDHELASEGHGAKYSPFTLAANTAGVPGLAHFFNAMIVLALVSMANVSIYASSRALQSVCNKGMGPRWAATVRNGNPVWAIVVAVAFAMLGFINAAPGGEVIFDWLLSLSGVSNYFTWASICVSHIRFRRALRAQKRELRTLIWLSPFGEWGSWLGAAICVLGLLAQILTAAWPLKGVYDVQKVLRDIIGIPFILLLFGGYLLYHGRRGGGAQRKADTQLLIPLATVDLNTGRRDKISLIDEDSLSREDAGLREKFRQRYEKVQAKFRTRRA